MDIGLDLQRAYDDGYKKGWEDAEAYALHCGDTDEPQTNADRIRAMTDEELAEFCIWAFSKHDDSERFKKWSKMWILEWLKKEVDDG